MLSLITVCISSIRAVGLRTEQVGDHIGDIGGRSAVGAVTTSGGYLGRLTS